MTPDSLKADFDAAGENRVGHDREERANRNASDNLSRPPRVYAKARIGRADGAQGEPATAPIVAHETKPSSHARPSRDFCRAVKAFAWGKEFTS